MRGCIGIRLFDCGPKLRDRAFQIPGSQHAAAGIGRERSAACKAFVLLAMAAPNLLSALAPRASPCWRNTPARVVWAPAKSGCRRIASRRAFAASASFPAASDSPQSVKGFSVIRTNPGRGAQFSYGAGELALLPKCDAQRVMDVGLTGVELRGLLKFGDCLRQLILEFESEAEVVMQSGIVGRGAQCRLEFGDRRVPKSARSRIGGCPGSRDSRYRPAGVGGQPGIQ